LSLERLRLIHLTTSGMLGPRSLCNDFCKLGCSPSAQPSTKRVRFVDGGRLFRVLSTKTALFVDRFAFLAFCAWNRAETVTDREIPGQAGNDRGDRE
jgi:hypothetical protein